MDTIYTAEYFYKKFSAIPEERWRAGNFSNQEKTQFCAHGHCGNDWGVRECPESNALGLLFSRHRLPEIDINDGKHPRYQQPTPKQRILAALSDIIRMEGKQVPTDDILVQPIAPEPKVVYKTIVIDSRVKEMANAELNEQ